MSKITTMLYLLIILVLGLSACSTSPSVELYEGRSLKIGVIGEAPEVKEKQVKFQKIAFDDLSNEGLMPYDAVFIMDEYFSKASDDPYVDVYLNTEIPFFFIGSNKSTMPFRMKGLRYENASDVGNFYSAGFLSSKDGLKQWQYGLYTFS